MSFTETVWERRIDSIEEASSGTPFVPSLDSEWLSGEELHSSVDRHDIQDSVIRSPSPPKSALIKRLYVVLNVI